jgi:hypothetical protein
MSIGAQLAALDYHPLQKSSEVESIIRKRKRMSHQP